MQINIKNIVKLSRNCGVTVKPFRKYLEKGALVYVEEIDDFTVKLRIINKDDLFIDEK